MAPKKNPTRKNKPSTTRRLHRSLGAGAALFILFMALSGLAINHSNGLGLDQRHVSQPQLLSWYGLGKPEQIRSYAVGDDWLSFAGSQLYLNDKHISTVTNAVGAVSIANMLIAASSDELLLLDHNGQLLERLPWGPPMSGPFEAIGLLANGLVAVKSMNQLWMADESLLSWQPVEYTSTNPAWSVPGSAPGALHQSITQLYRGDGLSLERLLLDLHSGRIFGTLGILVYDLLALAVGFLAISGLVLWLRGRRNGKRNGKQQNPHP